MMHIACLAVVPLIERALRVVHHDVPVRGDTLAVERRLRQSPLSPPEVALACQQAVAEDPANVPPKEPMFDEVLVLRHEDLLDIIWMAQHERRPPRETQIRDVAMVSR